MFTLAQAASFALPVIGSIAVGVGVVAGADVMDYTPTRAEAYALASNGQCDRALPMFETLGETSGQASDYLGAANCAIEMGERDRAIRSLQYVLAHRYDLSEQDQAYALRAYGFQAEAVGDYAGARSAWTDVFTLTRDGSDAIQAARLARSAGDMRGAGSILGRVDDSTLVGDVLWRFLQERAYVHSAMGRPVDAVDDLGQALTIAQTAELRFRHGLALNEAGMPRSAIHALETARRELGDDPDILLPLAYAYRAVGQSRRAQNLYSQARASDPRFERFAGDFVAR